MITTCLVKRLSNAKSGIKKSDAMVNRFMTNAINRGGLTAAVAAINLILILAVWVSLSFYLPLLVSIKLYMNSVLASLNSQDSIKEKYTNGLITDNGIAISNGPLSTIRFVQSIPEDQPSSIPFLEITAPGGTGTDYQGESKINRNIGGKARFFT